MSTLVTPHFFGFVFNDTAPIEFYTLSLHDALPILVALAEDLVSLLLVSVSRCCTTSLRLWMVPPRAAALSRPAAPTSPLPPPVLLVCRLLLGNRIVQPFCSNKHSALD